MFPGLEVTRVTHSPTAGVNHVMHILLQLSSGGEHDLAMTHVLCVLLIPPLCMLMVNPVQEIGVKVTETLVHVHVHRRPSIFLPYFLHPSSFQIAEHLLLFVGPVGIPVG